jgi:hypothetical protein
VSDNSKLEARLDRKLKKLLGKGLEHSTPERWRDLRAMHRINLLYPGQYVAYRNPPLPSGGTDPRNDEVLHASRNLWALNRWIDKLPPEEQRGVNIIYVEPEGSLPFIHL